MRKIAVIIFVLVSISANAQIVNKFRDSTWFKSGVRFDSTLFFTKGAGSGKVLTSDANGRATWQTFSSAGVTQGALDDSISDVRAITTTLTDSLATKTNKLLSFTTYTSSDTLRLTDADKVIEMNVGTANNLVIPTNTAYAFPVGTQIVIIQIGAGQTTIVPASGVTVYSSGSKLKLTGQYSTATLIKKSTNTWYLAGDITN